MDAPGLECIDIDKPSILVRCTKVSGLKGVDKDRPRKRLLCDLVTDNKTINIAIGTHAGRRLAWHLNRYPIQQWPYYKNMAFGSQKI